MRQQRRVHQRGLHRAAACAVALALLAGGSGAAAAPGPVQAPHHGDTLFHFFQDQHFTALTGLMVSQHFQRLAPHGDEAEVLRGGLLLSYGLHTEAGEVFARLIEHQAAPAVRDRAWFFLAKIRHQRGLAAAAEAALAHITAALPAALEEEHQLLRAQLLLARGDHAGAAAVLQALVDAQPSRQPGSGVSVARFNLGVALLGSADAGQSERGLALLDELGRQPAADEEQRSLRDRANVALGFAALQSQQPERARAVLQRVRLSGLHANKALLGFGWAATERGDVEAALAPFTELAARSDSDAAVLEAQIALPFALAEAGATSAALAGYQQAVERYAQEQGRIETAITTLRGGQPLRALLARHDAPGTAPALGWFGSLHSLPPAAELPHAQQLAPVLAAHDFQEGFKNLRDLAFLGRNLADWQSRLSVFDAMLATRRLAYQQRLPPVLARAADSGLPVLQARQDALAAALMLAEAEADGAAFVDPREQALLQRLERVRAALQRQDETQKTDDDADLALAAERLRRVAGALTWQLSQAYPERLWSAKKALRQVQQALDQARGREAALSSAQLREPARHADFAARIFALAQRLEALHPRVAGLAGEQQAALQDLAVAALQSQQQRLDVYTAQARLALAQLLDRVQLAQRTNASAPAGAGGAR